jgi:hypothetical protein
MDRHPIQAASFPVGGTLSVGQVELQYEGMSDYLPLETLEDAVEDGFDSGRVSEDNGSTITLPEADTQRNEHGEVPERLLRLLHEAESDPASATRIPVELADPADQLDTSPPDLEADGCLGPDTDALAEEDRLRDTIVMFRRRRRRPR